MGKKLLLLIVVVSAFIQNGCKEDAGVHQTLFSLINPAESGMVFQNDIVETEALNIFIYGYLYNGGGVAIGDINNDDKPDVYLSSSQGEDKLFLNKGNFEFEDISAKSGISPYLGMKAGVNMVDINNDGWLDIYVCRQGFDTQHLANLLFINNGDLTFTESAEQYGIDDKGYGSHSVFFDMENDGDLDLYVLNHPGEFKQNLDVMLEKINKPSLQYSDRLYRNDDGRFVDVTESAGIVNYGYGLGIAAGDMNNDGFTDLYVANDFAPHDYYYVNNGDGTFTEALKDYFRHCSYFSMGCDLADLNGDGSLDLLVVEMLSEENKRQKTNMAPMDMNRFDYMVQNGLYYQYMRNTLQINNGMGYFSDIAHYSGIEKTDWSWGSLFGDYDNDGDDDLIVVNGYLKDTQDKDFSKKSNELAKQNNNTLTFDQANSLLKSTPLTNYAFENTGELVFQKKSKEWGFDLNGFSNGVAVADLDGDGDLDIVVNNINENAALYRNNTNNSNFIDIKLDGGAENRRGLNAKLTLVTDKGKKYKEFQVSRGFQSSMDYVIHFGLAPSEKVEYLDIVWNTGERQRVRELKKSTVNTVRFREQARDFEIEAGSDTYFDEIVGEIDFVHEEILYNDYEKEVLLPHKLSQLGPALAVGDVNGDGLEDVYIGGSAGKEAALYLLSTAGGYSRSNQTVFNRDKSAEDVAAVFFDADGDGDLDLYVGSGGNQFPAGAREYKDRLYVNDGLGNFTDGQANIPATAVSTGSVSAGDFDKDGDLDLFVGCRILPAEYPLSESSFLLENRNGKFVDVTADRITGGGQLGMVSTSCWVDLDSDGWLDLVVAGEWMDILIFKNAEGRLQRDMEAMESSNVGWWNKVVAIDIDNDGDQDIIAGNLGLNYKYKASEEQPFEVYSGDFDKNGRRDIALGYYSGETLYPVRGFQCSSEQIPSLKNKIHSYEEFGSASLMQIYGDQLKDATHYKATEFGHLILWNNSGKLTKQKLPFQTQWFPIMGIVPVDVNGDDYHDLVVSGNWYVSEVETPRADAGNGLLLIFDPSTKSYRVTDQRESGIFTPGDVRQAARAAGGGKTRIIVGNNSGPVQVFEKKK